MRKITSEILLQKKALLLTFLILDSLFISENAFSRRHWTRDLIEIEHSEDTIIIFTFYFINYEFGPFGEHGYLECCDVKFSLDGLNYKKLMGCEVEDQQNRASPTITMKDKLSGEKIIFWFCYFPPSGTVWAEKTRVKVKAYTTGKEGIFRAKWILHSNQKINDIEITGKWHVKGLYCNDEIKEKYIIPNPNHLEPELNPESKLNCKNEQDTEKHERNEVKVYIDANAIVVNGVDLGEKIKIYTSSGILIHSTVAHSAIVKIKLPVNQIYVVNVRQKCFKSVL